MLRITCNVLSAIVCVAGLTSAAYAACCQYNLSWTNNGQSSPPCTGPKVTVCESSSVDCTPPATGQSNACRIKAGVRKAECTEIEFLTGGEWALVGCSTMMPSPWVFIGRNPDGSCCWVKDASFKTLKLLYTVDNCTTPCSSQGEP